MKMWVRILPRVQVSKVKERPNLEELKKCISEFGYVKTGKKYGVSDNCIRKWLKKYMEE